MPDLRSEFEEIERRRERCHIPVAKLCRQADINQSTYHHLKGSGHQPQWRTVVRLKTALAELSDSGAAA